MQEVNYQLPMGTEIAEFRILDVLGEGGFGITYKAEDTRLHRLVAIKEFLPVELAARSSDSKTVMPRTNVAEDYQYGLNKFLDEARTLASFNHPNIVKILNFIEANGTAYLVMEYIEGEALDDHLKNIHFNGNMAESRIREIIEPILKGLAQVHKAGLLHRDIKPGNIYLQSSSDSSQEHGNNPMLIDFGAARQSVGEKSKSISAIISQGYAPPEQYTTRGKQGPYTDIYAIGAVMYYLVTGVKPVESTDRQHEIMDEQADPLTAIEKGLGYSDAIIDAITNAMLLRISNRIQNVNELQRVLSGNTQEAENIPAIAPDDTDATRKISKPSASTQIKSVNLQQESKVKENQASSSGSTVKWLVMSISILLIAGAAFFGYQQYQQELVKEQGKVKQQLLLQRDRTAWQKAQSTDTEQAYSHYLSLWPKGASVAKANKALESIRAQKKQAQLEQVKNDQKLLIRQAQILLSQLNYKVPNNGVIDTRTTMAVKSFEKEYNLVVTGAIDEMLIESLNSILAKRKLEKDLSDKREKEEEVALELKRAKEVEKRNRKLQETAFEQQRISNVKKPLPEAIQVLVNELQTIPTGSFQMGCVSGLGCQSNELPVHKVTIKEFEMMATEVTFAMWDACVADKGCSHKPNDRGWGRVNRPIINVSFHDITKEFIPWLNKITGKEFSLPSESQWEYSARTGTNTVYPWGNKISCSLARYGASECNIKNTVAVKSYSANAWGLHDMQGNVWEFTRDCWQDNYNNAPSDGSARQKDVCKLSVLRGGSWSEYYGSLGVAVREYSSQAVRNEDTGFRLVLMQKETEYLSEGGMGIEKQDLTAMTNKWVNSILSTPTFINSVTPPKMIIDSKYLESDGVAIKNKNMITDSLRIRLNQAADGKITFYRDVKNRPGVDYRLLGRVTHLDEKKQGELVSRYTQVQVELIDLNLGTTAWNGLYEFKKNKAN